MSTINAIVSPAPALVTTVDSTGNLVLQTAGTNAVTYDANQNATHTGYISAPNTFGFKNRLINGAMVIDQRNAGGNSTANGYTVDRFQFLGSQSNKLTWGQSLNSASVPTGFRKYLGFQTGGSAYSVTGGDYFLCTQYVEGYNFADMMWGTANAKTVTLSFWVQSSLTGTFGGALVNVSYDTSYPFSYTINSANTWEYKTITVTGSTSGNWNTTNDVGVMCRFVLGCGTSRLSSTANAWVSGGYDGPTGSTSILATASATFYITGVQLEAGKIATPFDYRPYGNELALCQRYFEMSYSIGTVPGTATTTAMSVYGGSNGTGSTTGYLGQVSVRFVVQKRATPSTTAYDGGGTSGVSTRYTLGIGNNNGQNINISDATASQFNAYSSGTSNNSGLGIQWTASAEL